MKKILVFISLFLYLLGCGSGEVKSTVFQVTESKKSDISTSSVEPIESQNITARYDVDHVSITELSALFVDATALDIALSEDKNFAYIATGSAGLSIIDISDPYHPKLISSFDTKEFVNNITVVNSIAYVSNKTKNWNDYLSINAFDISDPYDAKFLGYYESFRDNDHKLVSKDGMVYFIDEQGFKVVSEKDYSVIGRYDLFDTAYAFSMRDNIAFVANGRNGLTILQIGDTPYDAVLTNP